MTNQRPLWTLLLPLILVAVVILVTVPAVAQPNQENDSIVARERDRVEVDEAFEAVLQHQEFRRLQRIMNPAQSTEKSWMERFFDWLFNSNRANSKSTSSSGSGFFAALGQMLYWLAWTLAITATAYVGWILLKAILKHFEDSAKFAKQESMQTEQEILDLDHPPGELPSDEYERRAVILAASGNYKAAVRELVLGSMSWIERSGLIRYRRGLTNRDYVRAIWRKQTERQSLEHIVGVFERAYFGRRPPDQATFDQCRGLYQQAFLREDVLVGA